MYFSIAKIVVVITLLILFGCKEQNINEKSRVIVPVLDQCKKLLLDSLAKKKSENEVFDFDYQEFGIQLRSHPNLKGYVELSSYSTNQTALLNLTIDVNRNCYPNSISRIPTKETDSWKKLGELYDLNSSLGISHQYITVSPEIISLHYYQEKLESIAELKGSK